MQQESIESYLLELKPLVDKSIEKWLPRKYDERALMFALGKPKYENSAATATKSLSEPMWDFLDRGGKRWRPALLILVAEALGLKRNDVIDFAVIPEIIHNGTLVVDDIEDSSDMRRGKPTMHKLFGVDTAINAGNSMYFLPLLVLIKDRKLSDRKAKKIYDAVAQEMINVSFGQAIDIAWHRHIKVEEITEGKYLQMCAYKTGALARMTAKIGAILAGVDEEKTNAIADFAESIGVAFQIQDDILNIRADEKWGKEFGEDIKEGKFTLVVIHTLAEAGRADAERLEEILNMHTNDRKLLEEAISIIQKYNSIAYAKNLAVNMVKNSWAGIEKVFPESEAKRRLKMFADFLVEREL